MQIPITCPSCGSDQLALEIRDWFGDDPLPPAESYGTFIICTKCGKAWADDWGGDSLWS